MEITYYSEPFDHWVIDDFIDEDLAYTLSNQFADYDSDVWYVYENPLELKKAMRDWYTFPSDTYKFLCYLNSPEFVEEISTITGSGKIFPDIGLHGAGWHIHKRNDKLNLHLDYSIHPQLELQRKYNLILYLTPDWNPNWGGNIEFWHHDKKTNSPSKLGALVENRFNRAVLFDTTQNSWHGFPTPIRCPHDVYRKSIAMYYLQEPPKGVDKRQRAWYAPTEDQKYDTKIQEFIKQRAKW